MLAVLARVADSRHRRGVRHRLAAILGLALCAVVAGARSFTAIAEWAADADEATLAGLVALDGKDAVRAAAGQVAGVLALGVQRAGGDDRPADAIRRSR